MNQMTLQLAPPKAVLHLPYIRGYTKRHGSV